ncbi:PSD1 and planctomycete cytochrome C domain-containing protein [Allomuricauda sp. SCSIO 65647]|uniref:PSD1 and planctomycete cytochrome C domain-containing protein n=1 Tax=Allomuricauda sp. SCSIO 65647 TaxID=2908843 RepID=UPI001F326AD0|nr:PSD1 and planctomycete cytochrome C domain-containing protein [Muricauda sp. SCSIO 65647]UJH67081.1 PSD1 and planctomycete cytochrome C domain-containing protein [Muricauda sp. SCSIO 65647]
MSFEKYLTIKETAFFKGFRGVASFSICLTLLLASCKQEERQQYQSVSTAEQIGKLPDTVDFSLHIKPILSDRCFKCHGPDENAIEADLSLHAAERAYKALGEKGDRYAIVPGDVEKSELVKRIFSEDQGMVMPPPESNLMLSDHEKELLKKWVAQGAEYKEHWAFVKPSKPRIPSTIEDEWCANEIDAFILKKLNDKGYEPSPKASNERLIRRISFDITGLPPDLEQIDTFIANDSESTYEMLIDSFLNSIDYAESMAASWMDVARYADTHGYQDDFERTMWPWRDWVIKAFYENMPYDEFVTVQLAGDLLPNATKETILATGFNRNHKITAEGGVIPEEYRIEYVEDRTNTFGTAFLGMTMECARCHDHKYDPVSQKEHFQLFGFFNNIDEKGLLSSADEIPAPYVMVTKEEAQGVLDFVNMGEYDKEEVPVMVMKEMKEPRPTFILDRGVYDQPTEQVSPATPERILPFPEEYPKNRLGLAKWLFHQDNPLTARVVVNRVWQKMFGKGLVESSYDFGNQGSLPTHPELLDFLAVKFMEEGWDLKKLIKYIAMSSTYRQSTKATDQLLEKDPENNWLARAPRLRLPAETIRDQALKISGLLNKTIGGPSVKPYQPEGIWEETTGGGGGSTARYVLSEGKNLYRKSLYTFWKRTVPPPSMMTFDASSRDLCSVKREETNTPLQALVLLNDPQLIETARAMAYQTSKEKNGVDEQILLLFRKATSRLPNDEEMKTLKAFYANSMSKIEEGEINIDEYLAIGEFSKDDIGSRKKWAGLALTAHAILNLDETITRG